MRIKEVFKITTRYLFVCIIYTSMVGRRSCCLLRRLCDTVLCAHCKCRGSGSRRGTHCAVWKLLSRHIIVEILMNHCISMHIACPTYCQSASLHSAR